MIEIKEVEIEEVLKVHKNVLEFGELKPKKENFENRYNNREKLIIAAYYEQKPIGYMVAYDKFEDGESIYCWMVGVHINYRRKGTLKLLMEYFIKWAKQKGYSKIKIKTRNNRREMLSFLVKNNFYFTEVEKKEDIIENRILLEKQI